MKVGIAGVFIIITLIFVYNPVFGQSEVVTSLQTTLSEDLDNDPIAQDILDKIEKSKRWIAKLQERNFEESEKQRELEEKRAKVLEHLQEDLKKWEELWEYSTFDKMLERALENSPAKETGSIYDHPLKFTASKINAGHNALQIVIQNGGGPEEARDAFVSTAKITKAEMISANAIYNVLNGNAYYNQQILFDTKGQFDLDSSGEQLRKYYLDYRTSPGYLLANPKDTLSWEDLSKTNPNTECREEYVLIYRNHADDYVCVTEHTSEMWQRHGMGSPVHKEIQFIPDDITQIKMNQDRITEKISSVNLKIKKIHDTYEIQIKDMEKKYHHMFMKMEQKQKDEEKLVLNKLNNGEISRENFSSQITDIREKYDTVKNSMIKEKFQTLEIMEKSMKENLDTMMSKYAHDSEIKIIWNSDESKYEIVQT